ncbi:unnamed protein product [Durusdinium trenchii]|uniref:TauD/TfdA-like domain-containing protein n=1 Tax=Durusdinium trenchii TaxID=1381693 RepID=A0ABP0IYR3_9DINO
MFVACGGAPFAAQHTSAASAPAPAARFGVVHAARRAVAPTPKAWPWQVACSAWSASALTLGCAAGRRKRRAERTQVVRLAFYDVTPREGCSFGASVRGFSVKEALENPDALEQIKADMYKHRLLIFHGQTDLMPEDHIKLSEALGSLEHILHRPHPKAPDPRLLRVANDDREGFMSVGTSGWHVDGVMLQAPFAAQTMHHLHAIPGGDTLFLGMKELYHSMDEDLRELCDRLWFVSGVGDDLQQGEGQMSLLPLVYDHPFRGDKTMCFHLGQTYCLGFIEEVPLDVVMEMFANVMTRGDGLLKGARAQLQRILAGPENNCPSQFRFLPALPVQESLQKAIDGMDPTLRAQAITKVDEWERGDLALIDNMALAHLPAPGTQTLPLVSGLRVFHRTTMTNPSAVPRNLRGASAVLLAGPRKDGPTSDEAVQDPDAMRDILRAVMAATPINVDELGGDQRGGDLQMPKNIPARDEALRALEETQQPLDLLKVVDAELEAADGQSREIFGKTLKKLLREYHPDRNQSRTKQAVPIFRYLWRLHKEQGRAASAMAPTKGRVVDRLRQKASKITVGDVVG